MKRIFLIAFFSCISTFLLIAQTPEIRCKKLLDDLTSKMMFTQKESEFRAKLDEYDKLYPNIANNGWWKGQSELLNGGYYLFFKKDILKAKELLLESEQTFKENDNPKELLYTYFWLAFISEEEGNTKQATQYYFKVIELIEKYRIDEKRIIAISYNNLGKIFEQIGDTNKAIFYIRKAASIMSQVAKTGNYDAKKYPNSNIVRAYNYFLLYNKNEQFSNLDSAYKIAKREYVIIKKQNNLYGQSQLIHIMISYYALLKKHDELLKQYDEAITIGNQVDSTLVGKAILFKIDAFIGKNKYQKALTLSDSLDKILNHKSVDYIDFYQKDILKRRLKIYKETRQFQKALVVAEELLELEKQTTILKKTKIINDLEIKYETEKKKKEILVLTAQNQIKSARIKQKNYLIFAISALVLSLCGGFFFWFRQRKLKEKQSASDMKQRLLRAQLNPHFLFNCLNSIQRLYVDGKFMQANEFIADFAQLMRDILEKTGRTTIPLYEEMDFIEAYLSLEKRRLGDKFDYEIIMDEEVRNGDFEVPSFIVQPLAENALLHGILPKNLRGKIEVIVDRMNDDSLSITVKDDGVGYYHSLNKAGKHTSKGMELIKSRLGKQGKMLIEELKNLNQEILGTKIVLELNMQ